MPKWEYTLKFIDHADRGRVVEILNAAGQDGWEAWHMAVQPSGRIDVYYKRLLTV